ncbi:MAG TPA: type III secretion system export apparatus subunit SctV [Limnobacter sp.]|uniref:type III secretion system export apparatus subunit SctV n=1 Tax=Limnobacter sp. TaxID=2003368 RepID=UPI002ED85E4C
MLSTFNKIAKLAADRSEVVAAAMILLIVMMMIIPLSTVLLDVLIAINMTAAILLLISSILLKTPLSFSSFPAVLLISTLLRLSLTISTTRLILLNGYAGEIIETFGNFVIGGNIAVGLILFLIISVVNFIVITKGSERVAEVAARFSLDGMPGKQMSIDSDLRAGLIDQTEAKKRRSVLEKETQLFGAMDGAIKFVKGDAIAGLVIAAINILGGIGIGMLQKDMSFSEAGHRFSILSVGDGLIGQIPALMVSLASGLIVTRVTKSDNQESSVARDILFELGANPKALVITGSFAVLFAIIPGMPSVSFLAIGVVLVGMWYLAFKTDRINSSTSTSQDPRADLPDFSSAGKEDVMSTSVSHPIQVRAPANLSAPAQNQLQNACRYARNQLVEQLGVLIPTIDFSNHAKHDQIEILVFDVPMIRMPVPQPGWIVELPIQSLEKSQLTYRLETNAIDGQTYVVVDEDTMKVLLEGMATIQPIEKILVDTIQAIYLREMKSFFNLQDFIAHTQRLGAQFSEQLKELDRVAPAIRTVEVLVRLLNERVSIRNFRTIVSAITDWSQRERDSQIIAEQVRIALREQISNQYAITGEITGYVVSAEFEDFLTNAIRQTNFGTVFDLEAPLIQRVIDHILKTIAYPSDTAIKPVLVCSIENRRHLRMLIQDQIFWLPVLSFNEIGNSVRFQVLGELTLNSEILESMA